MILRTFKDIHTKNQRPWKLWRKWKMLCLWIRPRKCAKPLKIQINQLCMPKRALELAVKSRSKFPKNNIYLWDLSDSNPSEGCSLPSCMSINPMNVKRTLFKLQTIQNLGLVWRGKKEKERKVLENPKCNSTFLLSLCDFKFQWTFKGSSVWLKA